MTLTTITSLTTITTDDNPPVQKVMIRINKAYDFNYYNFSNYYNYR